MQRDLLQEKFFTALISGNRPEARQIIDQVLEADCAADKILARLVWPTLEHIQKMHKADQLSTLAQHYATRLLRMLVEQLQMRLPQAERCGKKIMIVTGAEDSEELAGHMAADLLESAGYDVFFVGGGVANDEIVAHLGELNADVLLVFGAIAATVPQTRLLIDHLHEIGVCPRLQIVVGGGVFNRADGLAEEIGADLWAKDPEGLVEVIRQYPEKRMAEDQRTVGRKRRTGKRDAEAA